MQRNLVDNGGWLDEVLWIVNTQNGEDLRYLDEIIARNPKRHKKIIPEERLSTYTYYKAWRHLERGKYYVKIDDDIVRLPWLYSVSRGGFLAITTLAHANPFFFSSGSMTAPFLTSSPEKSNIRTTSLSLGILSTTLR